MAETATRKLRVLWATDGSENALAALPLLRQLLLPASERVFVLTVAPHPLISAARPDPAYRAPTRRARRRALAEALAVAERSASELGPAVDVEALSRWGHPIERILQTARSKRADVIVVGAKGHTNLGLMLLGSVTQGVVQHATHPVLIARPGAGAVDCIVVGFDGSRPARKAVAFLERLNLPPRVKVVLTYVVEPFYAPARMPPGYRERGLAAAHEINVRHHRAAERTVAATVARKQAGGRSIEAEVVSGRAGEQLDAAGRRLGAELIVVGSRKPSPARHYLLGSTAEKLVRHARASVLVVR